MEKIINEIPVDLKGGQLVSLDIEMFGQTKEKLHRPHGKFACISVAVEGRDDVIYQLYDTADLKKLFLSMKNTLWVGHNMLYDLRQLIHFTPIKPRPILDIMLLEQSMYGGYYQNFSLRDLARRYLGVIMDKTIREEFADTVEMTHEMKQYAARDAKYTLQIAMKQLEMHQSAPGYSAYKNIDEKMIWPILDMPGVPVNAVAWEQNNKFYEEKSAELQNEIGINVNSAAQVKAAVKKAGIHILDTRAETLLGYSGTPIVDAILQARMFKKATSTYGLKWLEKNVEADGKVYSSYHITGAETGRMSSSGPNMQNIPARKLPIFRTFFISSPGHTFTVDDVSEQEPCILAYESKDQTLLSAITNGIGTHLAVAREIFDDPKMEKADPRRAIGKTINLGLSYGLSAHGLASRQGLELDVAEQFIQKYFAKFPGVFAWVSMMRQFAYANGFIKTASGRKVYINPYNNSWQNNAINSPIQGGAADFTKMWVRKIWEKSLEHSLPYTVCLIVHDEVGQDTPKEAVKEIDKIRKEAFVETATTLYPGVPMKSEVEKGRSWACKSISEEMEDDDDEE